MIIRRRVLSLLLIAIISIVDLASCSPKVKSGADVLVAEQLSLLAGKRVGVICNHTSLLADGTHLVDALLKRKINVTTLFGPEHGVRGSAAAGRKVGHQTDSATGLPVYSLYSDTRKPSTDMLANVDVLVFDIQDVGARYYTYIGTMAYAMEAAAQNDREFIVLDRPNPINGVDMEGPILDMTLRSFTGMFPIPIRHGLTVGEIAKMIIGEGWIQDTRVRLTVVPMKGWKRIMWYDETGLKWLPPSPNMRTLQTAIVYPGTCLFETTSLSEGRGTEKPFEWIGAPFINGDTLAARMNALNLDGVRFEPITFTPKVDSIAAPRPKHREKKCGGVFMKVTDRSAFRPVDMTIAMFTILQKLYGSQFEFREGMLDHFIGDSVTRWQIQQNVDWKTIIQRLHKPIEEFDMAREKYLLYK